jgi:hypothetical protein
MIRAGDRGAIEELLDRLGGSVERYCAELCPPAAVRDAVLVAFSDFFARLDHAPHDADPDQLLLMATRSAASGRAEVRAQPQSPAPNAKRGLAHRHRGPTATGDTVCPAVPELLAAAANGELRAGEALMAHVEACPTCRDTSQRMEAAAAAHERAIGSGLEPDTRADVLAQRTNAPPPAPSGPEPTPAAPLPAPIKVRRRQGGLIGAAIDAWARHSAAPRD